MINLTCVTAVFNAIKSGNRDNLIRCVMSVAELKTEHEHLIYDGASTDGTVELLRELETRFPNLKVVSEPDTGIYNALNKGVRDAKGEWFYVLGCDDYIKVPEVLDQLIEQGCHKVAIVAPIFRDKKNSFFRGKNDLMRIFWTVPYSHQGLLVRTKQMKDFNGFDTQYRICADWDLMLKLHSSGSGVEYTYQPYTYYAEGGVSETSGRTRDEVVSALARHLSLSCGEVEILRARRILPLRRMVPYLFHRDLAFRLGSVYMIARRVFDILGLIKEDGSWRFLHR